LAFDLRAILRLDGNQYIHAMNQVQHATTQANHATQLWRDQQGRLRDSMGRFASQADRSTNSMNRFSRSISSPLKGISGLTTAVMGLASAYYAVDSAKKIFENTVGEAAKYEQSSVIIGAMLNDKQLGKEYMQLVDRFAIDSPILDSQGMLANSKSFLTASKDMKQLEQMWSLAERMAAIDPYQGLEGAVFALRELFSGDAISMVRRFEMPKTVMNEIKKMDLPDQLRELDKYFSSIGMTQKLIDEMGTTTLGVWAQIKEATNVILRNMGAPALVKVKDFLNEVRTGMYTVSEVMKDRNLFTPEEFTERMNRAILVEKFKETGAKIIDNVVNGLISSAVKIGSWFESLSNNSEFQKQSTLFGQVKFIIEDIFERFKQWMDEGGRDQMEKATAGVMQIVIGALEASIENVVPVAVSIGSAIGGGIIKGVNESVSQSWLAQLIKDPVGFAINKVTFGKVNPMADRKNQEEQLKLWGKQGPLPAKNGGLNRVPYDGYTASLHRGEMILPRGEADNYRNGSGGGGITISGNTFNVRQESDIQKIAYELAKLIEQEGAQMA
jgi:hypothetical protein